MPRMKLEERHVSNRTKDKKEQTLGGSMHYIHLFKLSIIKKKLALK